MISIDEYAEQWGHPRDHNLAVACYEQHVASGYKYFQTLEAETLPAQERLDAWGVTDPAE